MAEQQLVESGLLWKLFMWGCGALASGCSVLLGIIWKKHNEEIASIKESLTMTVKYPEYERNRQEMRENIILVHQKIENSEHAAQIRHDALMQTLLQIRGHQK